MTLANGEVRDSNEKIEVSFEIDAALLDQLHQFSQNPSNLVETAIRQWLRSTSYQEDTLARTLPRNPPVPPRGEWND
jgi:hypothetical protein